MARSLARLDRESGQTLDIISTRQVAELLAVSEATVKRWADAGSLRCFRTPGGHRKFRMEDVSSFLREFHYDSAGVIQSCAVPPPSQHPSDQPLITPRESPAFDSESVVQFRNAALAGDADTLVSHIAQSRLRGFTLANIFDLAITPALVDIGDRWARGVLTVTQEHVSAETVIEALTRTKPLIERGARRTGKVVLACPGEEQHDIAVRMATLLAHGLGFQTVYVGARAPIADLSLMIAGEKPRFLVLSASAVVEPTTAASDLAALAEVARGAGTSVIAGGDGYRSVDVPAGVQRVASMNELLATLQAA